MKMILHFFFYLNPILRHVQTVDKLFESKDIENKQLLQELVLLLATIGIKLVLPTCEVNLYTYHIKEFFSHKPYVGYQYVIKIEELRYNGLISNCDKKI